MSKTIRRKNSKPDYLYDENNWRYDESLLLKCTWRRKNYIKFGGKKHIKEIAIYHTDSNKFMNVPKWFRQDLNRNFRGKNKTILKKIISNDLYHDNFIPYLHDAMWLWW